MAARISSSVTVRVSAVGFSDGDQGFNAVAGQAGADAVGYGLMLLTGGLVSTSSLFFQA